MKIKKGKMPWVIFSCIVIIGIIALSIYQLIYSELEVSNLLMLSLAVMAMENFFEEKE